MASYKQWRAHADEGQVRRVTWVCGPEHVLIEEVVDHVRSTLDLDPMDYSVFYGGVDIEQDIWTSANQYSLNGSANRLVLVRDAQKLKRWEALESWLAESRVIPNVYLMFVSAEDDLDTGKKHQELIKNRGHLIRCGSFADKDLVEWVQRQAQADSDSVLYLSERVAGDLGSIKNVCGMLSVLGVPLTPGAADLLVVPIPTDEFVDSLCRMDKKKALTAVQGMADKDTSMAIGLLASRLDLLEYLNRAVSQRMTIREVASAKVVPVFLARQFISSAHHYDAGRVTHCRTVLAAVDDASRSGARAGVLESLVALW